jgi:NitT/TauT family transport system permease protein
MTSWCNKWENMRRTRLSRLLGWGVVLPLLVTVWHVGAARLQQPWLLPTPAAVAKQLIHPTTDLYASGSLLRNAAVSLLRVLIGFSVATLVAVPLGMLMGSVRFVRSLLEPFVELLRPLCPIAWIPFAIAIFKLTTVPQLFGVDYTRTCLDQVQVGMVFVLFWGAFFPILINTLDGVSGVRRHFYRLAWTLGANRAQTYVHVSLPAALPMILTGLRQGIATCWFVIIAAEMLPGASSGLGYLLMYAADQSDMAVVVACMILIAGFGALLNGIMRQATCRLVRWHGKEI